jgi:hypothetical protein
VQATAGRPASFTRKHGYRQAFVALDHGGRWSKAAEVPGSAALTASGQGAGSSGEADDFAVTQLRATYAL